MSVPSRIESPPLPTPVLANLSLEEDWALGEEAFAEIVKRLRGLERLEHLVEFGSGRSTARFALEFPTTKLTSIDHDEESYQQTLGLIRQHGISDRVSLELQKLRFVEYGGRPFLAYPNLDLPQKIEAAVIDGPPFYTLRGREACLYAIFERLAIGGLVVLDDYRRMGEQLMARNWLGVYRDAFDVQVLPVSHLLLVLTKRFDVVPEWTAPAVCRDGEFIQERYKDIQSLLANTTDDALVKASEKHRAFNARVWASIRSAYDTPPPTSPSAHSSENAVRLREIMREGVVFSSPPEASPAITR